jgi:hypothetical protein
MGEVSSIYWQVESTDIPGLERHPAQPDEFKPTPKTQEQATRRKREILKNVKRGPREENDYRD